MIAIDTNVLLRYLLADDKEQSEKARKLLNGEQQVLVTDVVLVETIWTLQGKRFQLNKDRLGNTLVALFSLPNIVFEDANAVWSATKDFIRAKPIKVAGKKKHFGFADALIINKSNSFAQSKNTVLEAMYTFDIAALEHPRARLP